MEWLTTSPIAHRGLHKGFSIPENSYPAFSQAIENNYTIELDVRLTKDKKIVVFHDKNLLRVCAVNKKIANQTYNNIKAIPLYNTTQTIPLLKDILALVNGQVPLLIEIKNYGKVGEFETLLAQQLDEYHGKVAICSFNVEVVKWFKNHRPNILRGFIYGDLHKFNIVYYKIVFLYRILTTKPDFISLDYKLLHTLLPNICRMFNKKILCWTVNKKKKMKKSRLFTDNFIFENFHIKEEDKTTT